MTGTSTVSGRSATTTHAVRPFAIQQTGQTDVACPDHGLMVTSEAPLQTEHGEYGLKAGYTLYICPECLDAMLANGSRDQLLRGLLRENAPVLGKYFTDVPPV